MAMHPSYHDEVLGVTFELIGYLKTDKHGRLFSVRTVGGPEDGVIGTWYEDLVTVCFGEQAK